MAGADAMPLPENICEKATQLTTGLSNAGTMKLIQRASWCISGKQYYDGPFS